MTATIQDLESEHAALGAMLLMGERGVENALQAGLRPHHFYRDTNGQIFAAMSTLAEKAKPIDALTVKSELARMQSTDLQIEVEYLAAAPPVQGNLVAYAERVIEVAGTRSILTATYEMQEALGNGDRAAVGRALDKMNKAGEERRRDSLSPDQWGEVILEYLEQEPEEGFIPFPFPKLTNAMGGGMLPGELLLISGFTSHGKSILADQMLDAAAKRGLRGHLYMTEMTAAQRGLRLMSRNTGIPYGKLRSRAGLSKEDWRAIVGELERVPYGVSVVSDWDIDDVVRDALRARFDLVVIDLIHGFNYDDERGLDRLSKAAQRLARVSTTRGGYKGTAVVIVAHLSGGQMVGSKKAARPKPGLHSLKGSTSLQQDPDFVLFVWQQDDDEGLPTGEGKVWLPKARSGENESVNVRLNPRFLRFDVAEYED